MSPGQPPPAVHARRERRGEYLTRDSQTLGSAEQERLKGGKRPPSARSAEDIGAGQRGGCGIPTLIFPGKNRHLLERWTKLCGFPAAIRVTGSGTEQQDEAREVVPGLLPLQTDV